MSNVEKLKFVVQTLGNISVPALFMETISIPLYNSIMTINNVCQDLMKQEEEKPSDGGPVISDIEVGVASEEEVKANVEGKVEQDG